MFLRLTPLLTLLASSVTGGCMTSDDARATTGSGGMLADRAGSSLAERAVSRLIVGNRESRRPLAPSSSSRLTSRAARHSTSNDYAARRLENTQGRSAGSGNAQCQTWRPTPSSRRRGVFARPAKYVRGEHGADTGRRVTQDDESGRRPRGVDAWRHDRARQLRGPDAVRSGNGADRSTSKEPHLTSSGIAALGSTGCRDG